MCVAQVDCTSVPGMKVLFWKRVFSAEATRRGGYSHVWFFDPDLEVWPGFDLPALLAVMRGTGAAIAQPAIAPPGGGGGSSNHHNRSRSAVGGGGGAGGHGHGHGNDGGCGKSTDIEFLRAQRLPRTAACVASTVPVVGPVGIVVQRRSHVALRIHLQTKIVAGEPSLLAPSCATRRLRQWLCHLHTWSAWLRGLLMFFSHVWAQVVEVMTPVFDANAWVGLHEGLISRWCRRSVCKEEDRTQLLAPSR